MKTCSFHFSDVLRTMLPAAFSLLAYTVPANAKDLYVSATGLYDGKEAYTDLQTAIDKAEKGDTVWVENGFVCDQGTMPWGGLPQRIVINKAITVRSRSGDLMNQPIIRGAIDKNEKDEVFGPNSIRCVVLEHSDSALIGFRLEGGAAIEDSDGTPANGGGIIAKGHVKFCTIIGNYGVQGGGIAQHGTPPLVENCVIKNNYSRGEGGGVYIATIKDSRIIGNHSQKTGGGFYNCSLTNCVVDKNIAATGGGGGVGFPDKPIIDCTISGNIATSGNGGGVSYDPRLIDCLVIDNVATNGNGGGVQGVGRALRTTFRGNGAFRTAPNDGAKGIGGGAHGIELVDCQLSGNIADYRGGGIFGGKSYNCILSGNTCHTEGGGVFGGNHYNDIIIGNTSTGRGAGAGWKTSLINCTVIGNKGENDLNVVNLVNTVAYGDGKPAEGTAETATHSCAAFLTATTENGNKTEDPKLGVEGEKRFLPLPGSPCLNAGVVQPWMNDPACPGFHDRNGRRRVIGPSVDIGALEAPYWGTTIHVR